MKKFFALILTLTAALSTTAYAFDDVQPSADYYGAVSVLAKLNILKGDDGNNFNPGDTITRTEFAAILCRISGKEDEASQKQVTQFTDVPETFWGSGYVKTAAELGIINGYGDGLFGPYDPVTYEQAVKMAVAALGYSEEADALGGYPAGYIAVAFDRDIISGINSSIGNPAKRSEVAVLTYNTIKTPVSGGETTLTDANFPEISKEDLYIKARNLEWERPVLENPEIINLGVDNDMPENLDDNTDYIINLPKILRRHKVIIKGGRNVTLTGGHILIPDWETTTADSDRWGIYIQGGGDGRTVHIEGVLISCGGEAMGDAMVINSPKSIIQVQNVRAENIRGDAPNMHADVIQPWGGVRELRIYNLTGYSAYQGFFLNADYNESGKFIFKNVNLVSLPEIAPKSGGYMLWLNTKDASKTSDTVLENFYVKPREGRSIGKTVWPDVDDKNEELRPVIDGESISWPNTGWISGKVNVGVPEDGDFVPVGVAGINY